MNRYLTIGSLLLLFTLGGWLWFSLFHWYPNGPSYCRLPTSANEQSDCSFHFFGSRRYETLLVIKRVGSIDEKLLRPDKNNPAIIPCDISFTITKGNTPIVDNHIRSLEFSYSQPDEVLYRVSDGEIRGGGDYRLSVINRSDLLYLDQGTPQLKMFLNTTFTDSESIMVLYPLVSILCALCGLVGMGVFIKGFMNMRDNQKSGS